MAKGPSQNESSNQSAEAFRRQAAEQMAQMLSGWLNQPPGAAVRGKETAKTPEAASPPAEPSLNDLQAWLNPFQAGKLPEAADPALMREFMAGLEAYKKHPATREKTSPATIIWKRGTTMLRDYAPMAGNKPVALVIPSLINRVDILDLAPDHSFLRFLAEQGLRPVVIDWDAPGEEEKNFTITDYLTQRLMPALDYLAPSSPQGRLHIVGYCMGGLLALALALLRREAAGSLTLMATPWNFAAAGVPPSALTAEEGLSGLADRTEPYMANCGCLPSEAMRAFFASVQPCQMMEKFARFAGADPTSREAERFVMSEDWLNDGVPLAAPVARECLREWYGENRPGKILWRAAGELIDPRIVDCPAYIIAPGKDQLVPPESSRPLARLIRGAVLHEPALGHIGLLASHAAPQEVWAPLGRWLLQH